jgi:hypothetical protein
MKRSSENHGVGERRRSRVEERKRSEVMRLVAGSSRCRWDRRLWLG